MIISLLPLLKILSTEGRERISKGAAAHFLANFTYKGLRELNLPNTEKLIAQ
jgi:hypothetical protein